jgi:hypothetical protein
MDAKATSAADTQHDKSGVPCGIGISACRSSIKECLKASLQMGSFDIEQRIRLNRHTTVYALAMH